MRKFLGKSKKGFTLIELMIVVAIIGILAAIAIPNFIRFQLKAKTSEGKVNIAAIRTAEEAYFSEFGVYVTGTLSPSNFGGTTKTNFADNGGFGPVTSMVPLPTVTCRGRALPFRTTKARPSASRSSWWPLT